MSLFELSAAFAFAVIVMGRFPLESAFLARRRAQPAMAPSQANRTLFRDGTGAGFRPAPRRFGETP
jgi:hypothetical protein